MDSIFVVVQVGGLPFWSFFAATSDRALDGINQHAETPTLCGIFGVMYIFRFLFVIHLCHDRTAARLISLVILVVNVRGFGRLLVAPCDAKSSPK